MTTHEPTNRTATILDIIDAGLAPADFPAVEGTGYESGEEAALDQWKIDGERTATWAANKLRRAYTVRADAAATAAELHRLADEHVAHAVGSTEHDVTYFRGKLREYHEANIQGTRKKSTTLPRGDVLKTNPNGVSTVLDDDALEALTTWAEEELPDALEYVDPKLKKAALKDALGAKIDKTNPGTYPAVDPATGEVIPGVSFVVAPGTFDVILADDGD